MADELLANLSGELWDGHHIVNVDTRESQPLEDEVNVGLEYDVDTRKQLLSAMIFFSLFGNFLVFCSFYPHCRRGIPRAKKMFLFLSIADCFVAFFTLGAQLLWEQDKKKYFTDNVSCRAMKFMQTYSLSLSGYMLVAIALERYYAITNTFGRHKKSKWRIIFPWAFSFVPSIPCPFLFHAPDDIGMCVSLFYSEKHRIDSDTMQFWRRFYITIVVVIVFVIPTLLLFFGYIGIYYKIIKEEEVFSGSEQSSSSLPRAKKKTLTLAMVITSVFLLTSVPYIAQEFYLAYGDPASVNANAYLVAWSGVISAFNSVLNPYIYLLFQYTNCFIGKSLISLRSMVRSHKNNGDSQTSNTRTVETALVCSTCPRDYETCV